MSSDRTPKRGRGAHSGSSSNRDAAQATHGSSDRHAHGRGSFSNVTSERPPSLQYPFHPHEQPIMADRNHHFSPPGKIALPPLPKNLASYSSSSKGERFRTQHACNNCRKAKAKCSGEMPCDKCRNEEKECIYGDGKRDKERKDMERMVSLTKRTVQKRQHTVDTLRKFALGLPADQRRRLEEILMTYDFLPEDDEDFVMNLSAGKGFEKQGSEDQGEDDAHADVGSPGRQDVITEDTNRDEDTRAAGYMGKSSAVTWVQRAKKAAANDIRGQNNLHKSRDLSPDHFFTDSSYHAAPSGAVKIETDQVDPYEWPPDQQARALVDTYFKHVHPAFPLICRQDFMPHFETCMTQGPHAVDQIWLALANVVLAIGAKYAHMTQTNFHGEERDHYFYYARARALGMDQHILLKDPEVLHTVCLGALGLYLLIADQLNRSWTICGIAIRHATTLGLHVRNEAPGLSDMDKEHRVRLWWSLYCLERALDELTGRPSCISDRDIGAPMPINVDESKFRRDIALYEDEESQQESRSRSESTRSKGNSPQKGNSPRKSDRPRKDSGNASETMSPASEGGFSSHIAALSMSRLREVTSSTFFIYRVRLSIISHEILNQLYCASLVTKRWAEVQHTIRKIDEKLSQWKASLPEEFDFTSPNQRPKYASERNSLSMFYNSTRLILFRPCVCRVEGRIANQSDSSKTFDANSAIICIQSAQHLIGSLPPIEKPTKVYEISACWNVVHYLVMASAVLMLELAYRADHMPAHAEDILHDAKMAIQWLRAMSGQSIAARKAWEINKALLKEVAPKVGGDTRDMPDDAAEPPGWKQTHAKNAIHHSSNADHRFGGLHPSSNSHDSNNWMNHVSYANNQGYPAATAMPTSNYNRDAMGHAINYMRPIYPFHGLFDRYDDFAQLPSITTSQDMLYNATAFASAPNMVNNTIATHTMAANHTIATNHTMATNSLTNNSIPPNLGSVAPPMDGVMPLPYAGLPDHSGTHPEQGYNTHTLNYHPWGGGAAGGGNGHGHGHDNRYGGGGGTQ